MRVKVPAEEVQVGDKVKFPNSRHFQAVESVEFDTPMQAFRVRSGDAEWLLPAEHEVEVERDEEPKGE